MCGARSYVWSTVVCVEHDCICISLGSLFDLFHQAQFKATKYVMFRVEAQYFPTLATILQQKPNDILFF